MTDARGLGSRRSRGYRPDLPDLWSGAWECSFTRQPKKEPVYLP